MAALPTRFRNINYDTFAIHKYKFADLSIEMQCSPKC